MKILLDTHYYLWSLASPERISEEQRRLLESGANTIYVSAVSIAEIAIKTSIGKLDVRADVVGAIERSGFERMDFTCEDGALLGELPMHHRDPFDRMLIAQATRRRHFIMTDDEKFGGYDCRLI